MIVKKRFTEGGAAKTGLSPTIDIIDVSDGSLDVNDGAMTELSNGWYKYDFSAADITKEYVYEIDGTMALACTEFYKDGTELWVDMAGTKGTPYLLTSPEMEVTKFDINLVSGNPDKVQIDLKIMGREETEIEIQTTLSKRDFEVPSP